MVHELQKIAGILKTNFPQTNDLTNVLNHKICIKFTLLSNDFFGLNVNTITSRIHLEAIKM